MLLLLGPRLSHRWLLATTLTLAATARSVPLAAQTPAEPAGAVDVITPADLETHIRAIAADSMQGRDTPSRGLEATARYIANQFSALGLTPGGNGGTWFQRYPIPSVLDLARSRLVFVATDSQARKSRQAASDSQAISAKFTDAVWLYRRVVPEHPKPARVIMLAGRLTAKVVEEARVQDKIVLYVAPGRSTPDAEQHALGLLGPSSQRAGLVILTNLDSAIFAWHLNRAHRQPEVRLGDTWTAQLRLEAVPGLQTLLAANGVDLARVRADTVPFVRELPVQVSFDIQFARRADDSVTAPNVIGLLEGTDPKLKHEYLVVFAHMDHTGIHRGQADSIANGTDDNASGAAGLIALAKAFSQPGARPARSLVFLATSGGAKNSWGSTAFLDRVLETRALTEFFGVAAGDSTSIRYLAGAVNLDMIGRHAGDSVVIDGVSDVDLPTPPAWVAIAHPELRLTVVNGGTAATAKSDHFAFVQQAVPSLYIHNGSHTSAAAEPVAIDADLAARILRLVFFVGQDVANAKASPQWNSEGRRHYLEMFSR